MYEFAHIGIVVKDLERSRSFYTQAFGCEFSGTFNDERLNIVYLKVGSQTIELLKYLKGDEEHRGKGVIDHIAFYVQDMEQAMEKVKRLGAPMLFDAPRDHGDEIIMFFLGPDGERIEFLQKKVIN